MKAFIFDIVFKNVKEHRLIIVEAKDKIGAFLKLFFYENSKITHEEINDIIRLYIKAIKATKEIK
jgi:hypothetical protein